MRIKLLDTLTKETVEFEEENYEGQEFNWCENNWSCDCNRSLKFGYELDEVGCGDTRFRIIDCDNKYLIELK